MDSARTLGTQQCEQCRTPRELVGVWNSVYGLPAFRRNGFLWASHPTTYWISPIGSIRAAAIPSSSSIPFSLTRTWEVDNSPVVHL